MTAHSGKSGKILFVIGSMELGGAEQHVVQVARQLKQRGWSPEFFVFAPGGGLTQRLAERDIPVASGSPPKWLLSLSNSQRIRARISLVFTLLALMRAMIAHRPLIAHFFLPGAYIVGGLASLVTWTRPRLMSRRSLNHYQTAYPAYARIERFLHRRMDRICGNSKAVLKQLEEEGVKKEQLRLIHNGIDLARFDGPIDRAGMRRSLGVPDDALVLIMVANLIAYKGHRDLLEALAEIRERLPQPWACLCVGRDDGIGSALRAQAEELGIAANVRWLGSRRDVPELLFAADIGILCSHEEGFSNAVLEGMAAKLPMVVTDVGGNREAVVDGETGSVVPARSPHALAMAIMEVVCNPQRRELGLRGRLRVETLFSLEKCVDAYEALYREL